MGEIAADKKRRVAKQAAAPERARYRLAKLLEKCRGKVPEASWGLPQGKEAW